MKTNTDRFKHHFDSIRFEQIESELFVTHFFEAVALIEAKDNWKST